MNFTMQVLPLCGHCQKMVGVQIQTDLLQKNYKSLFKTLSSLSHIGSHSHAQLMLHCYCSLIFRPSYCQVFDLLQYNKSEQKLVVGKPGNETSVMAHLEGLLKLIYVEFFLLSCTSHIDLAISAVYVSI